jgi:hypothetical protein
MQVENAFQMIGQIIQDVEQATCATLSKKAESIANGTYQVEKEMQSADKWSYHWRVLEQTTRPVSTSYQLKLKEQIKNLNDTLQIQAKQCLERLELARKDREVCLREIFQK